MILLLIGAPGSGKGTQAQRLLSEKSFRHLSTGDIFRKHFKEKSALGLKAQEFMGRGELVPDNLTNDMVREFLKNVPENSDIVFDGFPRNLFQGKALEEMLRERGENLDLVISLEVPDSVILERLSKRLWAPKSGRVYHLETNPPKVSGKCDESGET